MDNDTGEKHNTIETSPHLREFTNTLMDPTFHRAQIQRSTCMEEKYFFS